MVTKLNSSNVQLSDVGRSLTRPGNLPDIFQSLCKALDWFETSHCLEEMVEVFEISPEQALKFLKSWFKRGWLQKGSRFLVPGARGAHQFYTLRRKPQSVEDLKVLSERTENEKFDDSLFEEFYGTPSLIGFEEPTDVPTVASQYGQTVTAILYHVRKLTQDGHQMLFYAGKLRKSRGPAATRYCSNRTKARRAIWEWLVSEYDRLDGKGRAMGTELLLGWPISVEGTDRTKEFAEDLPDEMGARTNRED